MKILPVKRMGLAASSGTTPFDALFLGFSFLAMALIPYGMNVRFAAYWDEPMRWIAASQLITLAARFRQGWRTGCLVAAVAVVMFTDLCQYDRFFIKSRMYEPVSENLLRASKLVK